jgi:hypothetical protein
MELRASVRTRDCAIALGACLAAIGVLLAAVPVQALPIVAIDVDPVSPGIQNTTTLAIGATLEASIVVLGVEAAEPLNAFELDVDFASAVLAALLADQVGSFLVAPVSQFENTIGVSEVELAALTLGPGAAFGDGLLAVVSFQALAPGSTAVALGDVVLSQPFGVPIAGVVLEGAVVTVVPEPGTGVLVFLGAVLLASHRRDVRRLGARS